MDVIASTTWTLFFISLMLNLQHVSANKPAQIIESLHVKSDIRYRLSTTQIESVIRNIADKAQEVVFDVTLPKEAFIVKFSMTINGKVYDGEVKEKTIAKKQYQEAVEKGQSAGHVRQVPRHSNLFEVSANVENGTTAKFFLTYQEILHRKHGLYTHEVHINPEQAVNDFLIEVYIQENKALTTVKTPSIRKGSLIGNATEAENRLTTLERPSAESAHITYRSSLSGNDSTSSTFVVSYDVEHSLQGDVLVVDGYFVHFFSTDLSPMPKDIVFVLDVSGSMYGTKIQQLKDAMRKILSDLQANDRFSIITFSTSSKKWQNELSPATDQAINSAKTFIDSIYADGATNINNALLTGISELQTREDNKRVGMIFFLTDGLATAGVTSANEIMENILSSNKNNLSIFGLAFGTEADYGLLTTISGQNSGLARKIYEDSDAALQVSSLYKEISAVSMKDISINYLPSSVDEFTVTKKKFPVIFNGSEVIICGRLADNADVFKLEINGFQKSGSLNLTLEVDDMNNIVISDDKNTNNFFTMPRDFSGIVEKMWAFTTVKQLLKEKEIDASNETKVEEIKNKILEIALKYKFVTPLTSMVVTKPESPEKHMESSLRDVDDQKKLESSYGLAVPMSYHLVRQQQGMSVKSAKISGHLNAPDSGRFFDSGPSGVMFNYAFYPMQNLASNGGAHYTSHVPTSSVMFTNGKAHSQSSQYTSSGMITSTTTRPTSTPSDFPVSVILAKSKDLSFCLGPKSLKSGKYRLIKSPQGTELIIETSCTHHRCKQLWVKQLVLKSKGSSTTFAVSKNGEWIYQAASIYSLSKINDSAITISTDDLQLTISWLPNKKTNLYNLSLEVKSEKGYSGLIGKILNSKANQLNKWRKDIAPKECSDKATDISKFLKNKLAAQYRI